MQVLKRVGVDFVTDHGLKTEFEYERRGTRDLYAILDTRSGRVFTRCTDNHRQETFIAVFTAHVECQPHDAVLHYVCDNLAAHSAELFTRAVANLCEVPYPTLTTAIERRQWLQSEGKRIVIHFTPFHGSWLNQVEIWFGIIKSKALKGQSFASPDELSRAITDFSDTWNEHFAHPFHWTYSGEGLAQKVVTRFTRWLLLRHSGMERTFLHKQLQLLANLVDGYWRHVPLKHWLELRQTIADGDDYLHRVIAGHAPTLSSLTALETRLSDATTPHASVAA